MNIILSINNINNKPTITSHTPQFMESIFFTEKKKNIIIDGVFTKILYSTPYFTMTGLYIHFQISSKFALDGVSSFEGKSSTDITHSTTSRLGVGQEPSLHKTYIQFDPFNEENHFNIERLCEIETHILHAYSKKQLIQHSKTPVCGLKTQLYSGSIRAHSVHVSSLTNEEEHKSPHQTTISFDSARRPERQRSEGLREFSWDGSPSPDPQTPTLLRNSSVLTKYIKISGLWETEHTYGITYKVFVRTP